ncbi:hypothetical protein BH10PLA1_BH10PLA1_04700 [soil metagenome]
MNAKPRLSRSKKAILYGSIVLLLVGTLVSCNSFFPPVRQGWNKSFGPVVPHDKFPGDCTICHTGATWTQIRKDFTYDHNHLTKFELRGAHQKAQCLMCHNDRGPAQNFVAKGCAGCHIDVHRAKLGQLCSDCHNEQSWRPVEQIAKHNRTRFPLIGAHAGTACFACHKGAQVGNFEGTDVACLTCHRTDLTKATSPDHIAQGWTENCQRCHTPVGWKPAQFNHPSAFPLTAGHAGVSCTTCHTGGTFKGLTTDCASCHLQLYTTTKDPNHTLAGFSTACATCHSTTSWQTARFNHTAAFPLTGGHAGRNCSDCHKNNVFTGLSTTCVACHLSNFQATKNPNHTTAGFGTDCASCHSTNRWTGAKFNHPAAFPLTKGHAGLSCTACHASGVFTALSTACVACHLGTYQATTSPNHAASGFGTTCTDCHTTASWLNATFAHTAFPISSGAHKLSCISCHPNPATPAVFACIDCHTHTASATNPKHSDVRNYVYTSAGCYSCHSRGRAGGDAAPQAKAAAKAPAQAPTKKPIKP